MINVWKDWSWFLSAGIKTQINLKWEHEKGDGMVAQAASTAEGGGSFPGWGYYSEF